MRYDRGKIIDALALTPFGSQGWMSNKDMECPFCGKKGKWGIIFNPEGGATFHCWKCPRKSPLSEFLKKIGRTDLMKRTFEGNVKSVLNKILGQEEVSDWMKEVQPLTEEDLKPVSLPLRLKPLVDDEYLNSRGFRPEHYAEFEPSYTDSALEPKLHNFIVFKMKMNGVCVAWWARSRYSKEWHKENLEAYKRHEADLVLRYRNSENNFQNLLGGYDELIEGTTKTVIIVEGIFDKVNIDNLLGLQHTDDVKCCFTFGNNIGKGQIQSLLRKQVERVILLYDYKTINESKEAALRMVDLFDEVYVTAIRREGVDPGNITLDYLEEVLGGASDPINYFCNKIESNI